MRGLKTVLAGFALAATMVQPCSAKGIADVHSAAGVGATWRGARMPDVSGRPTGAGGDRTRLVRRADGAVWHYDGRHHRGRRDRPWGVATYGAGFALPYEDAGYGNIDGYAEGPYGPPPPYGPLPPYGPQEPYGDSFSEGYRLVSAPMAEALAPLAYGPGAHDGAYAYGYNGYAQTPPLP